MSNTTLADVRAGIAANLQSAFPDVQVSAYMLANPSPPCFDMIPDGASYDLTMGRGTDCIKILVRLMVAWKDVETGQINLDSYCDTTGANSVKAAIEVNDGPQGQRTLGGVVSDCRVVSVSGYMDYPRRQADRGDIAPKVGVEFMVECYT